MAERRLTTAGPDAGGPPGNDAESVLVVILNFNGMADTLACLRSLKDQAAGSHAVLVIDNGSAADDLGLVAAGFPDVEVIALPENLGWAGGNNVGLRLGLERGFGSVCLLNNDTVLDPGAIEAMRTAAAAFGPCLMHPLIAYFDEPGRWQLDGSRAIGELGPELFELDFAYGACLLLPAEVLRRVGLLDERFFLQLEETDYFHRARALGIPSACTARARILHKESVSFGGRVTPDKTYYQVRNTLLLAEKHRRTPAGVLATLRGLFWALSRQAGTGEQAIGRARFLPWLASGDPLARAARHGVGDYLRRRFGRRTRRGPAA